MNRLRFYWNLYVAAVKTRTEYRVDFVVNVFTAISMQLAALAFYWIVFKATPALGGWGSGEVLTLFGLTAVAVAVTELVFNGIWMLPFYIVQGEMDRLMVYPVRGLLFLLLSRPELHALGNLASGIFFCALGLGKMGVDPAMAPLMLYWAGCATLIYAGLLVGLACISFFAVGPFANPMMVGFHVHNAARYPLHIYPGWMQRFLVYVYPIGLAVYLPVKALRGEMPLWQSLALPGMAAVACVAISLFIWNFSLKRYQSTGS